MKKITLNIGALTFTTATLPIIISCSKTEYTIPTDIYQSVFSSKELRNEINNWTPGNRYSLSQGKGFFNYNQIVSLFKVSNLDKKNEHLLFQIEEAYFKSIGKNQEKVYFLRAISKESFDKIKSINQDPEIEIQEKQKQTQKILLQFQWLAFTTSDFQKDQSLEKEIKRSIIAKTLLGKLWAKADVPNSNPKIISINLDKAKLELEKDKKYKAKEIGLDLDKSFTENQNGKLEFKVSPYSDLKKEEITFDLSLFYEGKTYNPDLAQLVINYKK